MGSKLAPPQGAQVGTKGTKMLNSFVGENDSGEPFRAIMALLFDRLRNEVGKGENAGYPLCFLKSSLLGLLKQHCGKEFNSTLSNFNPLSQMPFLGSSNSAGNKDNYDVKNMDKRGHNYLI